MWRKQIHTLDHPPLLVVVEPILTRLEAGDDGMPPCRMLGRMLTRRTVAATDVPTLRTPTEMEPPAFRRRQAFDAPIVTRPRSGLIPRWSFFISNFPSVSWQPSLASSASHPQRPEFGTASDAPA